MLKPKASVTKMKTHSLISTNYNFKGSVLLLKYINVKSNLYGLQLLFLLSSYLSHTIKM